MELVKLSVQVEAELRRRVKIAATKKDQSVRGWIEEAIRQELEREEVDDTQINRASAPAFGRDWSAQEDADYDKLAG